VELIIPRYLRKIFSKVIPKFIREGWFWILLPTLIAVILIAVIIIFGDPYQKGALHGKFILLYSFFGD